MYDPAVPGNKSPPREAWFFIFFYLAPPPPQNVSISIFVVLRVEINGCKIYAKRIRWCQVFVARSRQASPVFDQWEKSGGMTSFDLTCTFNSLSSWI